MGWKELGEHPLIRLFGPDAGSIDSVRFTGFKTKSDLKAHTNPVTERIDAPVDEQGQIPASAVEDFTDTGEYVLMELFTDIRGRSDWVAAKWDDDAKVLDAYNFSSRISLENAVTSGEAGPQTLLLNVHPSDRGAEIVFLAGTDGGQGSAESLAKEYTDYKLELNPLQVADTVRLIDWTSAGPTGIPYSLHVNMNGFGTPSWMVVKRGELETQYFDPVEALLWVVGTRTGVVSEAVLWAEEGDCQAPVMPYPEQFEPGSSLQDAIRNRLIFGTDTFNAFLPGGGFTLEWPMRWSLSELSQEHLEELERKLRKAARIESLLDRIESIFSDAVAEIEAGHYEQPVIDTVKLVLHKDDKPKKDVFGPWPDDLVGDKLGLERIEGVVGAAQLNGVPPLNDFIEEDSLTGVDDLRSRIIGISEARAAVEACRESMGIRSDAPSDEDLLTYLAELVETKTFAGALAVVVGGIRDDLKVRAPRFRGSGEIPPPEMTSLFARIGIQGYDRYPVHGQPAWDLIRTTPKFERPVLRRSLTPRLDLYMRRYFVEKLARQANNTPEYPLVFESQDMLDKERDKRKLEINELNSENFLEWVIGKAAAKKFSLNLGEAFPDGGLPDQAGTWVQAVHENIRALLKEIFRMAFTDTNEDDRKESARYKIKSGMRNYEKQRGGFLENKAGKRLEINALKGKAAPGTSRHHFGTEVDLWEISNANLRKPSETICIEYEFLNRYGSFFGLSQPYQESRFRRVRSWTTYEFRPEDKEHETGTDMLERAPGDRQDKTMGYIGECWHWSYWPIAQAMIELIEVKQKEMHELLVENWNKDEAHHNYPLSKQNWPDYVLNVWLEPVWRIRLDE